MRPASSPALLILLALSAVPSLGRTARQAPQTEGASGPEAAPSGAASLVTVGDFALRVAGALQLPAPPAGFAPESAAWALLQKGIRLRPDLASPLTEADAVSVLNALGFRIRTETPSRVMSADRVGLLVETFIASPK